MDCPLFTIVMPAYNVAPYVSDCLNSVKNQTFGDWETICVDDGSTDETAALLEEVAAGDSRIRVTRTPHRGVGPARNAALDVAKGAWLVFLDADDVLAPQALQTLSDEIARSPEADVVQFAYRRFAQVCPFDGADDPRRRVVDIRETIAPELMGAGELLASRNAFRRDRCGSVRFESFVCGEDRLYTFRCLEQARYVLETDHALYGYRTREGSYSEQGIRTGIGWEGELLYRVAFLTALDGCSKCVDLSNGRWLCDFLLTDFISGMFRLRGGEWRIPWRSWRKCLPVLSLNRTVGRVRRAKFRLHRLPGDWLWCRFVHPVLRYLRYECGALQPAARLYRRLMGHERLRS